MHNLLLFGYKPIFMTSNHYLSILKKKYCLKSGGYLGTLDPFARGAMIIAFGQYTKLLPYLKSDTKVYQATLWLGAKSASLDIEQISKIEILPCFDQAQILDIFTTIKGRITYQPPKFSAKHIHGKRAYDLARKGVDFVMPWCEMEIFDLEFLNYNHPFLSFRVRVSSGAYIRSIGDIIANKLGVHGVLCMLERIEEAGIRIESRFEKKLNPLKILNYPLLKQEGIRDNLYHGKRVCLKNVEFGIYIVDFDDFFSIIEVKKDGTIHYLQNRISKC